MGALMHLVAAMPAWVWTHYFHRDPVNVCLIVLAVGLFVAMALILKGRRSQ